MIHEEWNFFKFLVRGIKKIICDKSWTFNSDLAKKTRLKPESPPVKGKVCYHYNRGVTSVYMAYVFDKNSGGKTYQVLWLLQVLYSALTSPGLQLQRQLTYLSWLAASGPDYHLMPTLGHLHKIRCIQILDTILSKLVKSYIFLQDQ